MFLFTLGLPINAQALFSLGTQVKSYIIINHTIASSVQINRSLQLSFRICQVFFSSFASLPPNQYKITQKNFWQALHAKSGNSTFNFINFFPFPFASNLCYNITHYILLCFWAGGGGGGGTQIHSCVVILKQAYYDPLSQIFIH